MKLLKTLSGVQPRKIIREDAAGGAVGAASIACVAGGLLPAGSMIKRLNDKAVADAVNMTKGGKKVTKTKKRVVEQTGITKSYNDLNSWIAACRDAGATKFKSIDSEDPDAGVRAFTIINGWRVEDVGYWADGTGDVHWADRDAATPTLREKFNQLREADEFDHSAVLSKLKSLETKEKANARDTATFGIEDDNGQVVRVTVKAEQAEEFENALQSVMAEMEDEEGSKAEIAEVLYKLKDHFDLIDVVWPEVQEDEEVQQDFSNEQGAPGEGGDGLEGLEDPAGEGMGMEDDLGGDLGGAGEEEVKGLLSQVIDMMKADAEARKADAEARKADAKQREQEMGAKNALARIKQEEQMLDMDEQQKSQREQDREAKRLAQLARWRSQMSTSGNTDATSDTDMGLPEENEEITSTRVHGRMSPVDLAKRLLGGK